MTITLKTFEGLEKAGREIHKELIEACKQGDRNAQYSIYHLYAKAMFNTCFRMLHNREDAEDMLQEVFTDTFRQISSFKYESTFGTWVKRITINKCINSIKKKKADLSFIEDMSQYENIEIEEEFYEKNLSIKKVKDAMQQLPKGSQIIFSLYLLEGYDHNEIAGILNTSVSNSKTQYMRAKRRIKEILTEQHHA